MDRYSFTSQILTLQNPGQDQAQVKEVEHMILIRTSH
jgi:hypothetical protein